ncbi:MAG: BREX-1 system phosphatase PglZ type A [Eubacteriales bacterium]
MSEFEKITGQLNSILDGVARQILFWYDAEGEYEEDIKNLVLDNAQVHFLETDNQFYTKYLLERREKETSFLIYAPFPMPPFEDNHLSDTIFYSKTFVADRPSNLAVELGLPQELGGAFIREYRSFFAATERIEKLKKLEVTEMEKLPVALMAVTCKVKVAQFEEILRAVLLESVENIKSEESSENKYLQSLQKYGLQRTFWKLCREIFGLAKEGSDLQKLLYTLFLTAVSAQTRQALPSRYEPYLAKNKRTILAFLESMMNHTGFSSAYEILAKDCYEKLNLEDYFKGLPIDLVSKVDLFPQVEDLLQEWLIERLELGEISVKVDDLAIPELCQNRRLTFFGSKNTHSNCYELLDFASYLMGNVPKLKPTDSADQLMAQYLSSYYKMDQIYRHFYLRYDLLEETTAFEKVRSKVENIYSHQFLNPLSVAWTEVFIEAQGEVEQRKQGDFFKHYLEKSEQKTVVIISDAFRYEVGQSLFDHLKNDEKCEPILEGMIASFPSYTELGMSALLPHTSLEMTADYHILADGKPRTSTKSRLSLIQERVAKSKAIQFDEAKTMTATALKDFTSYQDLIYVYHDQIDMEGDKAKEHEVFQACEKAIDEIHSCIKKFTSANCTRFLVTADHGFLYQRDKLEESDKIGGVLGTFTEVHRRFVMSEQAVETAGVVSLPLHAGIPHSPKEDTRMASYPMGVDVFKANGGQNYVHGGISLQELVIPVLQVKTLKSKIETQVVTITPVSLPTKITNLSINIEFIQENPVSDVFKEATYLIYFKTGSGEEISNKISHVANNMMADGTKRRFSLKFNFKEQEYFRNKHYLFVVHDKTNEKDVLVKEVSIDLAFTDDYNW